MHSPVAGLIMMTAGFLGLAIYAGVLRRRRATALPVVGWTSDRV
ncbi:hypothetical protein [Streptomyces sp. NBC_01408]|nr:hypothetical protein [Streptomyces sp. NBC_01408]MCX4696592.1 hypothetical protein [Streptomyces sp. NBC_01408]